jgi:hypothetical protein
MILPFRKTVKRLLITYRSPSDYERIPVSSGGEFREQVISR